VNPIGIYARKRKICAFYFTISNLPRQFRSSLQGIWLVALCSSIAVKDCGQNAALRPIISDLKSLENDGLFIPTFNRKIYASVVCVCADNLAGVYFL